VVVVEVVDDRAVPDVAGAVPDDPDEPAALWFMIRIATTTTTTRVNVAAITGSIQRFRDPRPAAGDAVP
jgi:hypothetical protein